MKKRIWSCLVLSAVVAGTLGCGGGETASKPGSNSSSRSGQKSEYLVESEPAGAIPVGEARQSVSDADEVVLVGRIGGSKRPFIDGLAAFTIVDLEVAHCAEEEGCPTPWDYCCTQSEVKKNIAMIKLVDGEGKPVAQDARELLELQELNTVVVHGEAERDESGNLALLADQVFVKE